MKISVGLSVILLGGACVANAQLLNPANGHYYDYVRSPLTWADAKAKASSLSYLGLQGHLATLTSQSEDDFLFVNFHQDGWLGAHQYGDTTPSNGWQWVTGEAWSYTSWYGGEPNDGLGLHSEQALLFYSNGYWNDLGENTPMGYYVEYEAVPEPITMALLGAGALALVRRTKK